MAEFKADFYFFWVESLIKAGIMSLVWWQMWSFAGAESDGFSSINRDLFMSLLLGTQILQLPYRGSERIAQMLEEPVVSGRMALVLCRPVHPIWMNLFRVLCQQLRLLVLALLIWASVLTWGFPAMGIEAHFEWANLPWMVISLLLSMLINFFIYSFLGVLSFWVGYVWSVLYVISLFSASLSGQYFPLHVNPSLEFWSCFLPFRYIAYSPVLVGSGMAGMEEVTRQIFILAVLVVLTFWTYRRGLQKFEASGG
jgi:ABC-type uncharacterized transport system permease subunit